MHALDPAFDHDRLLWIVYGYCVDDFVWLSNHCVCMRTCECVLCVCLHTCDCVHAINWYSRWMKRSALCLDTGVLLLCVKVAVQAYEPGQMTADLLAHSCALCTSGAQVTEDPPRGDKFPAFKSD